MIFLNHNFKTQLREWLVFKNYSPTSVSNVLGDCQRLSHFLGNKPFTKQSGLGYYQHMQEEGYSPSYINNIRSCLVIICKFAMEKKLLKKNWAQAIPKPHIYNIKKIEALSEKEIRKLCDFKPVIKRHGGFATRQVKAEKKWSLLIELMASCGMRRGEIQRLKVQDVDFVKNNIYVVKTKTFKPRLIPISETLKPKLKAWVKDKNPNWPLFANCDHPEIPLITTSISRGIKVRARRCGIKSRVFPHVLRHSFITNRLKENFSLPLVQMVVGHVKSETTERYTHLDSECLRDVINHYHGSTVDDRLRRIENLLQKVLEG